jgi:hypothetical protein
MDVVLIPSLLINSNFVPSKHRIVVPRCCMSRRSTINVVGGTVRNLSATCLGPDLIEMHPPPVSTSQLCVGALHSFSTILRIGLPSQSARNALIRKGNPGASGWRIDKIDSPLTSIYVFTLWNCVAPILTIGHRAPRSNSPKENPVCLQCGRAAADLTLSKERNPRVFSSWHFPHSKTMSSARCSRASANDGSKCSY